jgi:hypothetical protein
VLRDAGLDVHATGTAGGGARVTDEPAFTLSGAGELNHLKWMADTQHVSSSGYPGFDAVPGHVL